MKRLIRLIPILLLFVGLDFGTKYWATLELKLGGPPISVIPSLFQLVLVHNTGAAFGVGNRWSTTFFIVTSVVALGVVGYLSLRLRPEERFSQWGLALIMSGAIGNVVDRVRFGYVVDFFDAFIGQHHWPAFNVADAAITIGAILYGIDLLWPSKGKADGA
jgi:signal peptidase II